MLPLTVFPRFSPHQFAKLSKIGAKTTYNENDLNFKAGISLFSFVCGPHFSKDNISETMPSAGKNSLILKYTKVLPEAFPPSKGSLKAAGYDIKSAVDLTVPARGKALVDSGLKIELPEGCYGRIAPRSGLAVKNFIDVGGKITNIVTNYIVSELEDL